MYPRHRAASVEICATPPEVFAFADDHERLSSHMGRRSWAMAGSAMKIERDELEGRSVGSKLKLSGSVLGLRLEVEEVVVERIPPWRKAWETMGEPRLLVIGSYRMGFFIDDLGATSRLTVFMDYEPPRRPPAHWFGRLFGGWYARWCTERMAHDAARHFNAAHIGTGNEKAA